MNLQRCDWPKNELAIRYHDEEWGVPVHEDQRHFEFLILEAAQAGLSWDTVLKKRENYRLAFAGFNPKTIAQWNSEEVTRLMQNPGIVRNRLKIEAAIHNAGLFIALQTEYGSFDHYVWGFVGGQTQHHHPKTFTDLPSTSPESDALSKDLKKRGFKFVGSTIMYAYMQAVGLVNDHQAHCFRHQALCILCNA